MLWKERRSSRLQKIIGEDSKKDEISNTFASMNGGINEQIMHRI